MSSWVYCYYLQISDPSKREMWLYILLPVMILWCAVCEHLGPIYKHGLTLIPAWISNHILSKVWELITNSFSNFNGCNIKGWEWISNFIIHFILGVIIYSCRDYRWSVLVKGSQKWSNWLRSKQNGRYFADDILKFKLLNSKIWYLNSNFSDICSYWFYWQWTKIGWCN